MVQNQATGRAAELPCLTMTIMHHEAHIATRFLRSRSLTRSVSLLTLSTFDVAASPVSSSTYQCMPKTQGEQVRWNCSATGDESNIDRQRM